MNVEIEKIQGEKEDLKKEVMEKDENLVERALDQVLDQLEEQSCPESDGGWFCPETLHGVGELINQRIPLVLEVLYEEGHIQRKVNMGIPHYRLDQ